MDSDAPPHSPLSVADVLEKAADLIEPEGRWTQGAFARTKAGADAPYPQKLDEPACYCVNGALWYAAPSAALCDQARALLEEHIGRRLGPTFIWNDDPDRTQAEVVAALRSAAALARDGSGTQKDNPQGES